MLLIVESLSDRIGGTKKVHSEVVSDDGGVFWQFFVKKLAGFDGLVATRVVAETVRSPIVMGASMVAIGLTLDTVGID